jgi:GMP synthase (glutamine-hydrolysing)
MFDTSEFIEESIANMRKNIDDVAIIACSGGVDSTVAAVIANKAVGNLLHCVYVDTGFMRKGETEEIEALLAAQGIKNLVTVKAADRYFEALKGVTEPEQKRKVIGELFIRIFEDEQAKVDAKYLVQGTIAPDWIESGGGVRDTIKSHHNVGGLPEDMTLEAQIYCDGQLIMTTSSTKPNLSVDVWSGNHPFYTGSVKILDTEGRVKRFMKKYGTSN